jgi:hypothetical protein
MMWPYSTTEICSVAAAIDVDEANSTAAKSTGAPSASSTTTTNS